jgi:hypothetical protein
VGDGCLLEPILSKEGIIPPSVAGNGTMNPSASGQNKTDGPSASHTRNVIAASVTIPLAVAAVIVAAIYFIVLPWMCGPARISKTGDIPLSGVISPSRQSSFDENEYIDFDSVTPTD